MGNETPKEGNAQGHMVTISARQGGLQMVPTAERDLEGLPVPHRGFDINRANLLTAFQLSDVYVGLTRQLESLKRCLLHLSTPCHPFMYLKSSILHRFNRHTSFHPFLSLAIPLRPSGYRQTAASTKCHHLQKSVAKLGNGTSYNHFLYKVQS